MLFAAVSVNALGVLRVFDYSAEWRRSARSVNAALERKIFRCFTPQYIRYSF